MYHYYRQISATRTTDLPYTRITADQLPDSATLDGSHQEYHHPPGWVSQPGRRCTFYFLIRANPYLSHHLQQGSNPVAGRLTLSHDLTRLDSLGALPPATGVIQPRVFLLQTNTDSSNCPISTDKPCCLGSCFFVIFNSIIIIAMLLPIVNSIFVR